jgi:GNAT superfamily N-acetyltransferase
MAECKISTPEDLPRLVDCHLSAFPEALSSKLGRSFAEKMFEWYIVADRGILIHLEKDGQVIGYCGGIRVHEPGLPGAFTSISQHAFWVFVFAFVRRPWLLFHPENVKKRAGIVRNVLVRSGLRRASTSVLPAIRESFSPNWGLVVIGVRSDRRRHGHGSVLIREFERLAREDGVVLVQLSVKTSNKDAISSYEKNGWFVSKRAEDVQQMQKRL